MAGHVKKADLKKKLMMDRTDSCPSYIVGDGECDDECNTEENNWDGGDCCGDVDNFMCYVCECLDPEAEDYGTSYAGSSSSWGSSSSSSSGSWGSYCPSYWTGDGYCDDCLNDEANGFDGGDCCGDNVRTWFCDICECKE